MALKLGATAYTSSAVIAEVSTESTIPRAVGSESPDPPAALSKMEMLNGETALSDWKRASCCERPEISSLNTAATANEQSSDQPRSYERESFHVRT